MPEQEPGAAPGADADAAALPVGDPGSSASGASGEEREPDVRFTYANERTFLAWNRTALALIATGVAATQLLPKLQVEWGRRLLGLPLIALGAIVAAESLRQWRANQGAMRRGDPLPRSRMPVIITIGIVVIGAIAVALTAAGERLRVADASDAHDVGLAGERTALAWNRSGLAVVVCVAVLLRHVWPLHGTDQEVALGLIAAAVVAWTVVLAALTLSARGREPLMPHDANVFRLMTAGTLLLALVGFVAAFAAP